MPPLVSIVGTQVPDMAPATAPAYPNANECAASAVDFTDDDGEEILTFTAVSADTTKVEVVSETPVFDDADNAVVVVRGVSIHLGGRQYAGIKKRDKPGHSPVAEEPLLRPTAVVSRPSAH